MVNSYPNLNQKWIWRSPNISVWNNWTARKWGLWWESGLDVDKTSESTEDQGDEEVPQNLFPCSLSSQFLDSQLILQSGEADPLVDCVPWCYYSWINRWCCHVWVSAHVATENNEELKIFLKVISLFLLIFGPNLMIFFKLGQNRKKFARKILHFTFYT